MKTNQKLTGYPEHNKQKIMTRHALKEKIKRKFGSYHNFARLVGMQSLRGKTPLEIDRLAAELGKSSGSGIPRAKLSLLKTEMDGYWGGVSAFCKEHGFSTVSVHQILQGRRKRMSPIVTALFKHFGI
jgi:hypothetical protein